MSNKLQIILVVFAFIGLCGWFFSPLWAGSVSSQTSTLTPTLTPTATKVVKRQSDVAVTVVYKIITATLVPTEIPSSTPAPTQTARIIYRSVSPYPTYTPFPTATPFNGIEIGSDGCFIFNLYGVRAVFVDKTPVAPAYGGVRVCGSRLEVTK